MTCFNPQRVKINTKKNRLVFNEWTNEFYANVPCGKCVACQHNKRNALYVRLKLHHEIEKEGFFVTLTLNEDNPARDKISLSKKIFQDFFKRFRSNCSYHYGAHHLSYFACGEYGENTFRPHYHFLLWGIKDLDKVQDLLERSWKRGNVTISNINDARLNYVAKYMVKQQTEEFNILHDSLGIEKPFYLSSRFLGLEYFEKNFEYFARNGFRFNEKYFPIPRYYKDHGLKLPDTFNCANWVDALDPFDAYISKVDFKAKRGL